MRAISVRILASIGLATIVSAAGSTSAAPVKVDPPKPIALTALPAGFVQSNDALAAELYLQLAKAKTTGNLFFSPSSISTALAMTYAGARGDTAKQMAKTLHFDLPAKDLHVAFSSLLTRLDSSGGKNPELHVANRIFAQTGMTLDKDFEIVTHDRYRADVSLLDFKKSTEPSRKSINGWVESKTNTKITDLMPPGSVTDLTRMVLVNAIYFKGTWATQFQKSSTKDESFSISKDATKKTAMMHLTLSTKYGETSEASVLSLPYRSADTDHAMSMVVILPKAVDGLSKIEAGFSAKQLESYVSALGWQEVVVTLPKFKTTYTANLSSTLSTMGMPLAFQEDKADFSGITKADKLFISKVMHKAFVDVNEEGTEAAAATGVGMDGATSVPPPPKVFKADHPFAFMIRDDKTGAILFMGRMADPTA